MTRISSWFIFFIVVSMSFCSAKISAVSPVSQANPMFPEIKIRDQFRIEHTTQSLFSGKSPIRPLVLIASDQRQTEKYIQTWTTLLKETLGERVHFVGLANLRGLPFFVSKNSIRSSLKKRLPNVPVLCDWNGSGFKELACVRGEQNVHVYSSDRKLVGSITGKASAETAKAVAELVERASTIYRIETK